MGRSNLRNVKGFKDYLPLEAKRRRLVVGKLSDVFEKYGFEPLETPTLEYASTLEGKYGSEEKLIYKFETPGDDRVALKYDQTVPLARVIAQYGPHGDQLLSIPFKRFQIQSAFRGENTQKGRYREFLQCDVDIIGVDSPLADAEILTVVIESYKALGLDVIVQINDRGSLKAYDGRTLSAVDKLKKIGQDGVLAILVENGRQTQEAQTVLDQIQKTAPSERLKTVVGIMEKLGYKGVEFSPTLIRGLDYYTGIIIEVVLRSAPEASSLGGGGRWDEMIGRFCGVDMPAVGFSFGVDRTIEAMNEGGLFEGDKGSGVLVTIPSLELESKAMAVWNELQKAGISAELWLDTTTDMAKQFRYAEGKNLEYVVMIEDGEIVNLKRLTDGSSQKLSLPEVIERLK